MLKKAFALILSLSMSTAAFADAEKTGAALGTAGSGLGIAIMAKSMSTAAVGTSAANTGFLPKMKAGCASNGLMCAMLALTVAQVVVTMTAKSGADKTKVGFQAPNYEGDYGGAGDSTGDQTPAGLTLNEAKKELDALAAKGYKVDMKTGDITTPKGKFPSSAFGSGAAMAAAGVGSEGDIEAVDKILKDMNKDKYKVVAMALGGGGGGGGSGSSGPKYVYDDPYKGMNFGGEGEQPKDPTTAGLTRTLASGESIGSQIDDIFKMVTRRYQQKSAENIFVGP